MLLNSENGEKEIESKHKLMISINNQADNIKTILEGIQVNKIT